MAAFLAPIAGAVLGGLASGAMQGAFTKQYRAPGVPAFMPYNITSGLGRSSKTGNYELAATLSPEYEAIQQRMLGMAGAGADRFGEVSGPGATLDIMRGLAKPYEDRAKYDLENRLQAQGMYGSTGGALQLGDFYSRLNEADKQRILASLELQPRLMAQYQGIANTGVGGAMALDQSILEQLQQSINAGGTQMSGQIAGLPFQSAQSLLDSDRSAAFWAPVARGVGLGVESLFGGGFGSSGSGGVSPGYYPGDNAGILGRTVYKQ